MLEGSLVRLRPLEIEDVDRYVAWFNDPDVTRFLASRYAMSRASEVEWLATRTRAPIGYDNAAFAVQTLAEGKHIGSVGLHDLNPEDRKATFGIVIGDKEFWDHGYGTDATFTLLRFAFDEMNLRRVMLHVDERNARAIACYRKCGFVEEGRLRGDRYAEGRYWDTVVMAVLAEEFRATGRASE
jgi:RimJ/RimL family protein N-acetyltransferase